LGIGPNPQSPIPNPHFSKIKIILLICLNNIKLINKINIYYIFFKNYN